MGGRSLDELSDEGSPEDDDTPEVEGPAEGTGPAGGEGSATAVADEVPARSADRPGFKLELLYGLEAVGLAAFAFSRPVLDSFGRSPETFVVNGATSSEVIWFGLLVAVVPAALALAFSGMLGLVFGRVLRSWRSWAHVALLGVLGGVGAWRMGQDQTEMAGTAVALVVVGVVAAVGVGFLRWWGRTAAVAATFLRFASLAVLMFALQFLAASPASELAFGSGPVVNVERAEEVSSALGDAPPPVVVVVFDALPTASLLDGEGNIDGELFPNFARLADDSTFYRNHTSVAGFTAMAVPALLTGTYPEPYTVRPAPPDENVFTLLGGSYDVRAMEQVTRYCPADVCRPPSSAGLGQLLQGAADWWVGALDDPADRQLELIGGLEGDRFDEARSWVDDLQLGGSSRPDMAFLHAVVPHNPWEYLPDGTRYEMEEPATGQLFGPFWSGSGVDVGYQRHVLQTQAADVLLGEMLDKLEATGLYDDALVVVTADHGAAFVPDEPSRALSVGNAEEIAWIPLLVKEPGQDAAVQDETNLEQVDVVPLIADVLGVEVTWDVDGVVPEDADAERGTIKTYVPHTHDEWELEPGEEYIRFDYEDYFEAVLQSRPPVGSGPEGPWQLTEHGELVGADVGALRVEAETAGSLRVDWGEDFAAVDMSEPIRLEVVTDTDLAVGEVVAFVLNGTVAAVGEVQEHGESSGNLAHGLLTPWLFADGENEFTAYRVTGEVGDEVLQPIEVTG